MPIPCGAGRGPAGASTPFALPRLQRGMARCNRPAAAHPPGVARCPWPRSLWFCRSRCCTRIAPTRPWSASTLQRWCARSNWPTAWQTSWPTRTAPSDAPRVAGLAQVDSSGGGCLSHSQTRMLHGQTRYDVKSRFFDELPEGALKWFTPKNQGFTPSAFGYGSGYASTRGGSGGYGGGGNSYGGSKDIFASPPMPPQKAAPSHGLRSGMQVFHNKFDEGMVL